MNHLLQPNKKSIGKRIKHIKEDWDVSLTEMGKRLGISKPTMNSYVQGYSLPPKEIIEKLSKITGKSIEWFYYGEPSEYICDYLTLKGYGKLLKESPQIPIKMAQEYLKKIQNQTIRSDSLYPDEDTIDIWFSEYYDEAMSKYLFHLAKEFVQNQADCPDEKKEEITAFISHELYDTFTAIGYYQYDDEETIQKDIREIYKQKFKGKDNENIVLDEEYLIGKLISILGNEKETSSLISLLSQKLTGYNFNLDESSKELVTIFQSIRPKLIELYSKSARDDYYDWFEK